MRIRGWLFVLVSLVHGAGVWADGEVVVNSGEGRAVLLELYTSEGCSSCPPADRWMSALRDTGPDETAVVPLAFHITYWDYIGWKDRFGQQMFDDRQRTIGVRNRLSSIYTPQFVFNGHDYRGIRRFLRDMRETNDKPTWVDLEAVISNTDDERRLSVAVTGSMHSKGRDPLDIYLALYENGLSSVVERGENAGKTLHHDYVVRRLIGPFTLAAGEMTSRIEQELSLPAEMNRSQAGLAVFAQNPVSGEVLQAVATPLP